MNILYETAVKYIKARDYGSAFECVRALYLDSVAKGAKESGYKVVVGFRKTLKELLQKKESVEACYELLKKSYDLTAIDYFDDFMIALEWNRPVEQRFWTVRREQLLPICEELQKLDEFEEDELFVSQPPRTGKLLADDTPVLTTNGWKTHGELKVGDYVYSPSGNPVKVTFVHPKAQTTHTVTFTDGEKIECHFRHEWKVYDRKKQRYRILETQEMIGGCDMYAEKGNSRGHRYYYQIPQIDPIVGTVQPLKVDPYVLGVWLGDGTNTKAAITGDKNDRAIIDRIISAGYKNTHQYQYDYNGNAVTYYFETKMRNDLHEYGMCYAHRTCTKHIPQEYLSAPLQARLELLAGLIDTDGCLRRSEHRYNFVTADEQLKEDVKTLLYTFGWRVCEVEEKPKESTSGVVGKKKYWVLSFNPTMYIPCVLERKQLREFSKPRMVAIKSIEPSKPKQGNCITVDGGMYLVGKTLKPTHNSTTLMFFVIWRMLRFPETPNLYCSYSDSVVKVFFKGVLEILEDPITYRLKEIFPEFVVASVDSKDYLINIGRKRRYATLTCRSIDANLNGSCDVTNGFVIIDDIHSGINEAKNKDLLIKKWGTVRSNLLSRAVGKSRILWNGTRWSVVDCISMRLEMLENDPDCAFIRYKVFNVPALNEQGESNFDYMFHKGMTTEQYKAIRASYERTNDLAMWLAPYMGVPIEYQGAVFEPDELRYYNGVLPLDGNDEPIEPDRRFMVVDPAWGGGDYVAAVVVFQYGDDMFIPAVVYNNGDKSVTQPEIVNLAIQFDVQSIYIEATRVTMSYADEVDKRLRERGYRLNINGNVKNWSGQQGKAQRIYDKAPEIRERFIFLDKSKWDKAYSNFMQCVFSFVVDGKNKHDDAPDVLAMTLVNAFNQRPKLHAVSASLLDRF